MTELLGFCLVFSYLESFDHVIPIRPASEASALQTTRFWAPECYLPMLMNYSICLKENNHFHIKKKQIFMQKCQELKYLSYFQSHYRSNFKRFVDISDIKAPFATYLVSRVATRLSFLTAVHAIIHWNIVVWTVVARQLFLEN